MGLIDWFIQRRAKSVLKSMPEDKLSSMVSEYLKRTQREHADALKTAQSLNKASLMDMQTRKLKTEMRDLLNTGDEEDEEEDYEEDEQEEDDDILKGVIKNIMQGALSKTPNSQGANPDLSTIAQALTPEQKKQAKDLLGPDLG